MKEFDLIDKLNNILNSKFKYGELGPGDDSAIISGINSGELLVSKDLLIEGVHFDFNISSPQDIGWKALAVNESDIFAMGGEPKSFFIGLALPESRQLEALKIYEGFKEYLAFSESRVFGGDVVFSDKVCLSVTVIGASKNPILRSGAKAGDDLWISGPLGFSELGLRLLKGEKSIFVEKDIREVSIFKHKRPSPEAEVSRFLVKHSSPTSMIDVSDGFFQDLNHLSLKSNVSFLISYADIPCVLSDCDPVLKMELLNGGEDYRLIFTQDPNSDMNDFIRSFPEAKKVGVVTKKSEANILLSFTSNLEDGSNISLDEYLISLGLDQKKIGYSHF